MTKCFITFPCLFEGCFDYSATAVAQTPAIDLIVVSDGIGAITDIHRCCGASDAVEKQESTKKEFHLKAGLGVTAYYSIRQRSKQDYNHWFGYSSV